MADTAMLFKQRAYIVQLERQLQAYQQGFLAAQQMLEEAASAACGWAFEFGRGFPLGEVTDEQVRAMLDERYPSAKL